MIQQAFAIYSEEMGNSILYIEQGSHHIACWAKENNTGHIKAFELFRFTLPESKDSLQLPDHIFTTSKILQHPFEKTVLISEHSSCICIPAKFYSPKTATTYLQLMMGEDTDTGIHTNIHKGIVILSPAPADIMQAWDKKIKIDEHAHKYFTLIKGQAATEDETKLHCIFYASYFILSAYKNSQLLIIRHFDYSTPEDVLYHILNTFRQFDLEAKAPVIISGSIDIDSALYQMLHSYISGLKTEQADSTKYTNPGFNPYPHHYFTSFCEYGI